MKKAKKMLLLLLFGTFAGGIGFAFVLEMYLDRSFKRPSEIEPKLGLPLFLSIPLTSFNGKNPIAPKPSSLFSWSPKTSPGDAPSSNQTELVNFKPSHLLQPFFESLRDRLIMFFELKNMTHNPKLVAVTSCGEKAGVTTIASGLAASLSEIGEGNVLLVDMNRESGSAHYFHRGTLACSLDEALDKSEKRNDAQVKDKLYVVAETAEDQKLPRILHKRFSTLMPKLRASDFDYIIFDMPPVSQISPTTKVARFMDIVLMVVESEKTDRDAVKQASALLAESKANVGVVLNKNRTYVPRQLLHEL